MRLLRMSRVGKRVLEACEQAYKWNWPGDVRVAQCLLDVGIAVEWIHNFPAEAPGVIIHKQRPPPGSVAFESPAPVPAAEALSVERVTPLTIDFDRQHHQ